MESFTLTHQATAKLNGTQHQAIVGIVASGNLEVLAERVENDAVCVVDVCTASDGFGEIWQAVIVDFVERATPGGVRFSINDGGARPDTVMLRLMQAARALQDAKP